MIAYYVAGAVATFMLGCVLDALVGDPYDDQAFVYILLLSLVWPVALLTVAVCAPIFGAIYLALRLYWWLTRRIREWASASFG